MSRAVSVSVAIIATLAVFHVLVLGRDLLVPLAVAIMIWYVINAVSRGYGRMLLRGRQQQVNGLTLLLALVTTVIAAALVVNMVQTNIAQVSAAIPDYKINLERILTRLSTWLSIDQVPTVGQLIRSVDLAPTVSRLVSAFTAIIGNTGLIIVYVLFLLVEQKVFAKKMSALFPDPQRRQSVDQLLSHMQSDIQTYVSIKTLVSLVTGALSYVVLRVVGVDYAEFWAFVVFLLNYIPTIGSIVATVFPALLALIQFDTLSPFITVIVGLTAIQLVIGNFVEPKLMGRSLNLSPLVVLLSLVLWGSMWGVAGMFLSVPITVILMIVLAHFSPTRPIAVLLSGDGRLKTRARD